MSLRALQCATFVLLCATSASCSKYPTTSDKAKDWRLRRDAFQAATQVKLPKSSSYQPPEAIPKASATDENVGTGAEEADSTR